MVIIPNPGESAQGTENDGDVGNCPDDEDQIRVNFMVPEDVHDLEDEPTNSG